VGGKGKEGAKGLQAKQRINKNAHYINQGKEFYSLHSERTVPLLVARWRLSSRGGKTNEQVCLFQQ
jgi:hypothetical protein